MHLPVQIRPWLHNVLLRHAQYVLHRQLHQFTQLMKHCRSGLDLAGSLPRILLILQDPCILISHDMAPLWVTVLARLYACANRLAEPHGQSAIQPLMSAHLAQCHACNRLQGIDWFTVSTPLT